MKKKIIPKFLYKLLSLAMVLTVVFSFATVSAFASNLPYYSSDYSQPRGTSVVFDIGTVYQSGDLYFGFYFSDTSTENEYAGRLFVGQGDSWTTAITDPYHFGTSQIGNVDSSEKSLLAFNISAYTSSKIALMSNADAISFISTMSDSQFAELTSESAPALNITVYNGTDLTYTTSGVSAVQNGLLMSSLRDNGYHVYGESSVIYDYDKYFSVPAGNALVIENGSGTLSLSATFATSKPLIGKWYNGQSILTSDSLSYLRQKISLDDYEQIAWNRSSGHSAYYAYLLDGSKYTLIYNPSVYGDGSASTSFWGNPSVLVHLNGSASNVYLCSIKQTQWQSYAIDDYVAMWSYDGDNWVSYDGDYASDEAYTPVSNPSSDTIDFITDNSDDTSFSVNNLINAFGSLLSPAKNAFITISSYVQTISDFFSSLFTWLPADIFSVICSAVIIIVIVGLIKVFL